MPIRIPGQHEIIRTLHFDFMVFWQRNLMVKLEDKHTISVLVTTDHSSLLGNRDGTVCKEG